MSIKDVHDGLHQLAGLFEEEAKKGVSWRAQPLVKFGSAGEPPSIEGTAADVLGHRIAEKIDEGEFREKPFAALWSILVPLADLMKYDRITGRVLQWLHDQQGHWIAPGSAADQIREVADALVKESERPPRAPLEVPWDENNRDFVPAKTIMDAYKERRCAGNYVIRLGFDRVRKFVMDPKHGVHFMRKQKPARLRVHKKEWDAAFKRDWKDLAAPKHLKRVASEAAKEAILRLRHRPWWICSGCDDEIQAENRPEVCRKCGRDTMRKRL